MFESNQIWSAFVIFKLIEYSAYCVLHYLNHQSVNKAEKIPDLFTNFFDQNLYQKSRRYTLVKQKFSWIHETYTWIIMMVFLSFGGLGFLERIANQLFETNGLRAVFFCLSISFLSDLVNQPFELYYTFSIEQRFGFNQMKMKLYWIDWIKKWVLSLVLGTPLILFFVWIFDQAGEYWWIYGFTGMFLFQLLIMWIYPMVIAPIFNKFTPLEKGSLRDKIFKLTDEINFKISEIFVIDGSKRSKHSNAYFTGFGKSRRIVLYDTLINSLTEDELVSVLCHEIGHNKLKHIQKGILMSMVISFCGFYIWSLLLNYKPFYEAFHLSGDHYFPVIVIFPLVMAPVSFLLSPLLNWISRMNEFSADSFAKQCMKTSEFLKSSLIKLSKDNLSNLTPHPLYCFFYYSHPALIERIETLQRDYKFK